MDAPRDAALKELLAEVRRIEIQSRRLVTDVMSGGYRSVFRGSGIEFDEVREYAEGDDPRSMDWGVSARMGKPFVRKYAEERELSLVFLLDLSPSMEAGMGAWSSRGAAARVAACLALAAVRNSDKVGLLAATGEAIRFVPPRKGARHALSIVRDILALPARADGGDLAELLTLAGRSLRRRSVVFLLSDFLATGAWQLPLAACARRHDLVAVRLIGPEFDAEQLGGMLRMEDPRGGRARVMDWSSARLRALYRSRVSAWSAGLESALRAARVDRMEVRIPAQRDPAALSRPILDFFHMRETRGSRA